MTLKSVSILAVSLLLLSRSGSAQPLTLQQCIERAQQHSYLLKADQAQVTVQQKETQLQRSFQRPQLSGELAAEQRFLKPYQFNQSWALVRADWSFGDFILNSSQAAEQEALAAQLAIEHRRWQISQQAAEIYLRILLVEKQRDILLQRQKLLESHHDLTEALWQAGVRTQLDVLQTESNLTLMREELAQSDLVRDNLNRELRIYLGFPDDVDITVSPVAAESIVQGRPPEFSTAQLESVPALKVFDARIAAQSIRKNSVKAQQWPSLYAAGGALADGDPTGDGNYWRANIGLQMPLYRWGATKLQKERAQAELSSLEWRKMQVQRELTIAAQNSIAELNNLKTVLAAQSERQDINEKAFQFAQANYKAGLVTNLEYLTAQQQLAESQINLQTTRLRYVLALVEFYVLTNQVEKVESLK